MASRPHYSAEELERQYDVTIGVDDVEAIQQGYREASDAVAAAGRGRLDLAYGPDPLQRLDLFPVEGSAPAPLMVYIHGGYWVGGDKIGRRFPAPVYDAAGIAWAAINYRLAPGCTMDEIVADMRGALAWLHRHAADHGIDPDRIHVAGSSAGGHLTGMALAPGWHAAYGVPEDLVKGACPMSGLFDLAPMRITSHRESLAMDAETAARNSPVLHPPAAPLPVVVAWGARESAEFRRQSEDYAAALEAAGCEVALLAAGGHDHFSIMGDMARPDTPLGGAMLGLVRAG